MNGVGGERVDGAADKQRQAQETGREGKSPKEKVFTCSACLDSARPKISLRPSACSIFFEATFVKRQHEHLTLTLTLPVHSSNVFICRRSTSHRSIIKTIVIDLLDSASICTYHLHTSVQGDERTHTRGLQPCIVDLTRASPRHLNVPVTHGPERATQRDS